MKTFADYGIELSGGSGVEVATICPQCSPQRKKPRVKCLSVNTDKSVWHCHHCGWTGGLKGGTDQPSHKERVVIKPSYKRLPPEGALLDWFRQRGIPPNVIEAEGISLVRAYMPQVEEEVACIAFPYSRHGDVVNIKYRMLEGKAFRQVAGAENIPPIVARGVLIDVAALKGLAMLPDGYRITREDLVTTLHKQDISLREGDVVLIRTGRMQRYADADAYMENPPGIGLEAARFLVEESGAMIVGADNLSLEAFPSELETDYVPVHTYLLAEQGTTIIELAYLEDLSRDKVYEFAFIGGSLKLRGADAAPIRPIAIPLRK